MLRLFVTTLALWPVFSASGRTQVEERQLALIGGAVLTSPAERAIKNGVVVIRGNRIVAVARRLQLQFQQAPTFSTARD